MKGFCGENIAWGVDRTDMAHLSYEIQKLVFTYKCWVNMLCPGTDFAVLISIWQQTEAVLSKICLYAWLMKECLTKNKKS